MPTPQISAAPLLWMPPLQHRLREGAEISILSIDKLLRLNGKDAPWCKVSYTVDGQALTGYLWSGLLSPRTLGKDGLLFLYGMSFAPAADQPSLVDIKALKGDSLIARTAFKIASPETARGVHEAKLLPPKGLNGLNGLLYFFYSGEACAVPAIGQYIGWDGRQFILFPQVYSESDAGAYFIEQRYIFPADKRGRPGLLIMQERSEEYDDDYKPINKKVKTIRYHWDAAKGQLHQL